MSRIRDKIFNKTIGQKIREARAKKITQSKLGKALGVTFQQIQKYESGHNALSSLKLLEVSNFFNKPLEYFTSDATELLEKVRPTDNSSVKVSESLENV
jgi:transcriptional regulator with XRE-family HTH domain